MQHSGRLGVCVHCSFLKLILKARHLQRKYMACIHVHIECVGVPEQALPLSLGLVVKDKPVHSCVCYTLN